LVLSGQDDSRGGRVEDERVFHPDDGDVVDVPLARVVALVDDDFHGLVSGAALEQVVGARERRQVRRIRAGSVFSINLPLHTIFHVIIY